MGITINSWKSILLSACAPPFKIFIIGMGKIFAFVPPMYLYKGRLASSAAAFATAILTASIALAPSFPLLAVPSKPCKAASIPVWSAISQPSKLSAIMVFTFLTAFKTPLPPYIFLLSSLNSTASWMPVLAPLGTAALPKCSFSVNTSTSTVGLPRLSKI